MIQLLAQPPKSYNRTARILAINKELRTAMFNARLAQDYEACSIIWNRIKRLKLRGIHYNLLAC